MLDSRHFNQVTQVLFILLALLLPQVLAAGGRTNLVTIAAEHNRAFNSPGASYFPRESVGTELKRRVNIDLTFNRWTQTQHQTNASVAPRMPGVLTGNYFV